MKVCRSLFWFISDWCDFAQGYGGLVSTPVDLFKLETKFTGSGTKHIDFENATQRVDEEENVALCTERRVEEGA